MESNTIKLSPNSENIIELLYDQPKTGTNNYGEWFLYGVKKDQQEVSFFATSSLHKKLSGFGKGSKLSVTKEEYAPSKFAWTVNSLKTVQPSAPAPQNSANQHIDNRTHDIHKQVCLKLAIEMLGKVDGIITDAQLIVVDANMNHLLNILEKESSQKVNAEDIVVDSNTKDEFPF
jgi:arginine/lysine/ornithine decarboxylase